MRALAAATIYPAGQMWTQIANTGPPTAPNMPKLNDDEQILVMIGSETGEVRQCGNISGYCIGMKPWAGVSPQGQMAPLSILKHADDLVREKEEQAARDTPSSE